MANIRSAWISCTSTKVILRLDFLCNYFFFCIRFASTGLVKCKNAQKRAVCSWKGKRTQSKIVFARDYSLCDKIEFEKSCKYARTCSITDRVRVNHHRHEVIPRAKISEKDHCTADCILVLKSPPERLHRCNLTLLTRGQRYANTRQ